MTNKKTSSRILFRGLAVLELLGVSREGLPATEIAIEMGLHRSSIYRYLSVLVDSGYIIKTAEGRYVLGPRILELASLALDRIDLRNLAHSTLVSLCDETEATVHLCRLDGVEVIYLDKIETSKTLPLYSRIGARAPAYCTGVGKALLAYLQPDQLNRVIAETELRKHTEQTITDLDRLRASLAQIYEQGFAVDRGEHEEGIYCIAVPVFDFSGDAVAAISVTDLRRMLEGNEEYYRDKALKAAAEISDMMGFRAKGVEE